MFTVMSWNVENLFEPEPSEQSDFNAKLDALAGVITVAQPDAVAVQEVGDEASFEALRTRLGAAWTGVLSTHFESPHTIRVGWLSPRPLTDVEEVVDLPARLSPVTVDDDGAGMTQLGRGALAVTCVTDDGVQVRAVTAHLKSKLLSFPGGRFDTTDEGERVRYGVYALNRRAAESAPCGSGRRRRWPARGPSARCWCAATSTTPPTPPRLSCCPDHPGPSTAPAGTPTPTAATDSGCGLPDTGWRRRMTGPG